MRIDIGKLDLLAGSIFISFLEIALYFCDRSSAISFDDYVIFITNCRFTYHVSVIDSLFLTIFISRH